MNAFGWISGWEAQVSTRMKIGTQDGSRCLFESTNSGSEGTRGSLLVFGDAAGKWDRRIEGEVSILGRERLNADDPLETLRRQSGAAPMPLDP